MNRERIIGKVLLEGTLELLSPLLIGSGVQYEGNNVDTQILRDEDDRPFIPGTSIAGVLRAALPPETAAAFFGGSIKLQGLPKEMEVQSATEIDDVELVAASVVTRDGVSIDNVLGVAMEERKYDYELVERGAAGRFQATITLRQYHEELFNDISTAVRELAERIATGLRLGAMTAKGFGRINVSNLEVSPYWFQKKEDAAAWLSGDEKHAPAPGRYNVSAKNNWDRSLADSNLIIDATFALVGSLLVKDTEVTLKNRAGENPVHAIMKKSRDNYVIPGPSVKGALRHRAAYILEQLGFQEPLQFLNNLMGLDDEAMKEARERRDATTLRQSRLFVDEAYIDTTDVTALRQTRNRIDRFTGGTIDGALFTTEAIWGKANTAPVHIRFEIRGANAPEIGLALLLLKDLSLGRLPLGGEKSIGRGVLEGRLAKIWYKLDDKEQYFSIENGILNGDGSQLEKCVTALADLAKEGAA